MEIDLKRGGREEQGGWRFISREGMGGSTPVASRVLDWIPAVRLKVYVGSHVILSNLLLRQMNLKICFWNCGWILIRRRDWVGAR